MDWSGSKSAPLHADVRSHLSGSSAIQLLAASEESWHSLFFLFLQEPITYSYYYFFLTGMNWKLHSIVHGQIHLATQFTNAVKWHFQNSPLEAGFLVVKGKKKWDAPTHPPQKLQN